MVAILGGDTAAGLSTVLDFDPLASVLSVRRCTRLNRRTAYTQQGLVAGNYHPTVHRVVELVSLNGTVVVMSQHEP